MKHSIRSTQELAAVIRAVRKSASVRQDDLAATVGVSRQFTVDVEAGKQTVQFGRVLRLLEELGIELTVDIPDDASAILAKLLSQGALSVVGVGSIGGSVARAHAGSAAGDDDGCAAKGDEGGASARNAGARDDDRDRGAGGSAGVAAPAPAKGKRRR